MLWWVGRTLCWIGFSARDKGRAVNPFGWSLRLWCAKYIFLYHFHQLRASYYLVIICVASNLPWEPSWHPSQSKTTYGILGKSDCNLPLEAALHFLGFRSERAWDGGQRCSHRSYNTSAFVVVAPLKSLQRTRSLLWYSKREITLFTAFPRHALR